MTTPEPEAQTPRNHQVVAKAALLIVVVGATGVGLLAERQRRFEAAHTMTMAHRRAEGLGREIRVLRAEIADRLAPVQINARIDDRFNMAIAADWRLRPILWSVGAPVSAQVSTTMEPTE